MPAILPVNERKNTVGEIGGIKMGLLKMIMGEEPNPFETLFNYENVGQYGEYCTEYALGHDNLPGYGKTVHNVYIPYKGHTTEIDILLVHEKGIFVFESKNYSGWIFGGEEQQKWTQCLPNGQKHPFYNPLKQNETHCKALAAFLGVTPSAVSSYIIFSERCELKKVPDNTERYVILRRPNLLKTLRKDLKSKTVRFRIEQIDGFAEQLRNAANVSQEQKDEHVKAIEQRTGGDICPYCGAALVKRNGKFGAFYGCSAYPKCRFIRKIK